MLAEGAILNALEVGKTDPEHGIVIRPMAEWAVGTNSVDLHLSKHLATCAFNGIRRMHWNASFFDSSDEIKVSRFEIDPDEGVILDPGVLYLASTVEWTSSGPYVPVIHGTSGAGRLGICVHQTAGRGDVGFRGYWTLEITVTHPVRVYGGEPICQIDFHEVTGQVLRSYNERSTSQYSNDDPRPQPSRMWKKPRFTGQ